VLGQTLYVSFIVDLEAKVMIDGILISLKEFIHMIPGLWSQAKMNVIAHVCGITKATSLWTNMGVPSHLNASS
jgi:hypothetical protein